MSALASVPVRPGLLGAMEGERRRVAGVGVLSRRDMTDGARDSARAGVAGATELAREYECVRDLSDGGAGGRMAHPNSAVMMPVSEAASVVRGDAKLS